MGNISMKRLESGYYHIRGVGPCNYAQPPSLIEGANNIAAYSHPEASESFMREASAILREAISATPAAGQGET